MWYNINKHKPRQSSCSANTNNRRFHQQAFISHSRLQMIELLVVIAATKTKNRLKNRFSKIADGNKKDLIKRLHNAAHICYIRIPKCIFILSAKWQFWANQLDRELEFPEAENVFNAFFSRFRGCHWELVCVIQHRKQTQSGFRLQIDWAPSALSESKL